jgi:hypothetical protein
LDLSATRANVISDDMITCIGVLKRAALPAAFVDPDTPVVLPATREVVTTPPVRESFLIL